MINVVAIYMHNDYHNAKIKAKEVQAEAARIEKDKIELEVKEAYKQMMDKMVEWLENNIIIKS